MNDVIRSTSIFVVHSAVVAALVASSVVCNVAIFSGSADAAEHDLVRLDGPPIRVEVVSVTTDRLRVREGDRESDYALPSIAWWGSRRRFQPTTQVLLRDGGTLVGDVLKVEPSRWICGPDPVAFANISSNWESVDVPVAAVAGAIFQPPDLPFERDSLARQLRVSGADDQMWLEKGNQVRGRIESAGKAAGDRGLFEWEVRVRQRPLKIDHHRVTAVRLQSPKQTSNQVSDSPSPSRRLWLGFTDGSLASVRELTELGGSVHLELTGGGVAKIRKDVFYETLCSIQPVHDRVRYLSDEEPAEQRHQPFLTVSRSLRRNQSVLGGLARTGGRIYTKSLGVSSQSFVVYDIGDAQGDAKPWKRFCADVALDERAGRDGSVVFRVFLQQSETPWTPAETTGLIRGGDAPQRITVELSGAKRIALVVDFGERGDTLDYANWLNARVER